MSNWDGGASESFSGAVKSTLFPVGPMRVRSRQGGGKIGGESAVKRLGHITQIRLLTAKGWRLGLVSSLQSDFVWSRNGRGELSSCYL